GRSAQRGTRADAAALRAAGRTSAVRAPCGPRTNGPMALTVARPAIGRVATALSSRCAPRSPEPVGPAPCYRAGTAEDWLVPRSADLRFLTSGFLARRLAFFRRARDPVRRDMLSP